MMQPNTVSFDLIARTFAQQYLSALDKADLSGALGLFAPAAVVHSPLYGVLPAETFYSRLFSDTANSQLQLLDVLTHPEKRSAALYFNYQWTLANGEIVQFDVVDYMQFNEDGLVTALHIIYDTLHTRAVWEKQ